MADTCAAFPNISDLDLAKQYANSVVDRFQDQVRYEVLGNEWNDLNQLNNHLGKVRSEFEKDAHRIASSLVNGRPPTVRKSDKKQKEKDTKTLLGLRYLEGVSHDSIQSEFSSCRRNLIALIWYLEKTLILTSLCSVNF